MSVSVCSPASRPREIWTMTMTTTVSNQTTQRTKQAIQSQLTMKWSWGVDSESSCISTVIAPLARALAATQQSSTMDRLVSDHSQSTKPLGQVLRPWYLLLTATEKNCGAGNAPITNGDGSFNKESTLSTFNTDCGVERTWKYRN